MLPYVAAMHRYFMCFSHTMIKTSYRLSISVILYAYNVPRNNGNYIVMHFDAYQHSAKHGKLIHVGEAHHQYHLRPICDHCFAFLSASVHQDFGLPACPCWSGPRCYSCG